MRSSRRVSPRGEAGAAILHVHARNPDGSNTMDPDIYARVTPASVRRDRRGDSAYDRRQPTSAGRRAPQHRVLLAPEMCSLNMGLLNFFIRGEQVFFPNHRDDIERFAREMRARGVKPEFEVYNSAMLEEVAHLLDLDIFEPPYAINFVLHTPTQGGQRGTPPICWTWCSACTICLCPRNRCG